MYQSDTTRRDRDDDARGRARRGGDSSRWLVVLGVVAGLTLFVALLRYAIDLLGVAFVIALVGFALRTVSDWLTEEESLSAWAMSAVSFSLIGTVLVGVWLFNSRDGSSEVMLPGPVARAVTWMERQGWGQRVLLPREPAPVPAPVPRPADRGGRPGAAPAPPPSGTPAPTAPAPAMGTASSTASRGTRSRTAGERGPSDPAGGTRAEASGGTAATASPEPESAAARAPADTNTVPEPEPAPAAIPTTLTLSVSPDNPVVGQSVRLTARLSVPADVEPGGTVAFYDGSRLIGRASLRRAGHGWEASLVTLRLGVGDHDLQAVYDGSDQLAASRSPSFPVSVTRR